jgi:predicted PurR-regulated permease PerM
LDKDDLILEDWKMTKDRIKHFDDLIFRLRLEGIPIASGIIGVGLASFQYTSDIIFQIGNFTINATSIVVLLGAFYLMPVFALDMVYYKLLNKAVNHAREIESKEFNQNLKITGILTSHFLTYAHTAIAIFIYLSLMAASFALAIAVNSL